MAYNNSGITLAFDLCERPFKHIVETHLRIIFSGCAAESNCTREFFQFYVFNENHENEAPIIFFSLDLFHDALLDEDWFKYRMDHSHRSAVAVTVGAVSLHVKKKRRQ
jgi:hypothetical protein